jgi:ParB family chromosome partitioning protein
MSLSPSTSNNATQKTQNTAQELRELPIDAVLPNPAQPRRRFDEQALEQLARSIGELGVLQPVLVRPLQDGSYGLIAGERRWRAARLAGLQRIPALVSGYDDLAALEVGLIENMVREDLNPVEEARGCATLANELGLSYREIGERLGRSKSWVSNLMRILNLSEEILELLERGELTLRHGRALLEAKDPLMRSQLARTAVQEGWGINRLEARARSINIDAAEPGAGDPKQVQEQKQKRDMTAMDIARAWGDLLGVEVGVRTLRRNGGFRVEVLFSSAEAALASAAWLGKAPAGASKRG